MSMEIIIEPLTAKAFAPFGEILEAAGTPDKIINQGMCGRHHDLAKLDFVNGRAGISIFDAQVRSLPYELTMMERHPEGSQAFVPMSYFPFLIIVAADANGTPDRPECLSIKCGSGHQFSPQHMAWCFDTATCTRPFLRHRSDRRRRKSRRVFL